MAGNNLHHYSHGLDSSRFNSVHAAPPAQIVLPYENLVLSLLICGAFGILAAISRFIGFMTSQHIVFDRLVGDSRNEDARISTGSNIVNNKDDEKPETGSCHERPTKQQGQEYTVETSSGPSSESSVSFRRPLTCEFWVAMGLLIFVVLIVVFRKTVFVQGGGPKATVKAAAMALGVVSGTDVCC